MIAKLFLLFTLVPLVELYILLRIGSYLGALNTILLIVITGVLGALLARLEGIRTMQQIAQNLSQGLTPAEELIDAVLIFIAGLLLLTPGVLTDVAGLLLLFPPSRTLFKRWLRKKFDRMAASGNFQVHYRSGDGGPWT
ncbi:MAG TPA: FxsA family protein [Candidatus Binatia bacterium]